MLEQQLQDGRVLVSYKSRQAELKIFENKLFRWLCVDDEQAIQSCMLLAEPAKLILPYQQFMMMWQLLRRENLPMTASLLGIGGGDIIRYLRSTFPKMNIVAVDKEPQIARIASEYFLIKPDQNQLTLQIEDAKEFIKKPHRHDLLLIDIVANNSWPNFLSEISFWQECHSSLNQNGIMVVNVIPESEEHLLNILKMLKEVFGHLPLCMGVPEHKNIVLLMPLSVKAIPSIAHLQKRCVELQRNSDLPFLQGAEILEKDSVLQRG
ncbi:MAG: fused MFS/spermidine synthase [Sulfuriflexus sp.]|nr:fused MFS/spermidine synthase [Sulfuriflexus sp.]